VSSEPHPEEAPSRPQVGIRRIERLHWLLLAAVVALSFAVPGLSPIGVAAGGAFMGVNVNLMKRLLQRVLGPGGGGSPTAAIALLVGKTGLFLALLALLFWRVPLDGLSFAVGATLFLVAAVVGALLPVRSQGET